MVLTFNCRGNDKQLQAVNHWIDDSVEQILYGGGKGGGKSTLGCSLIFGDAFIYPGTHYFIARKELNDLRKFTIPSIHEVFAMWGIAQNDYRYNGQDNYYELSNASKVFLLSCNYLPSDEHFERFGSMQMTRGWIEEAGEVAKDAYRNLWLSIGRWKNKEYSLKKKLLLTANPKKNFLYTDFYMPAKEGTLSSDKRYIQALVTDNKTLDPDYVKSLDSLDGVLRQRLLLGNWEYDDDDNALIPYEAIIDSFNNDHIQPGQKRYITADIALEGSDKFVIGVWYGFVLVHIEMIAKSKPQEVIAVIDRLKKQHGIPNSQIAYDADGVGNYVGGFVIGAKAFVNNSVPVKVVGRKENYKNLKTQCYYRFAESVRDRKYWFKALKEASIQKLAIQELEQIKSADADKEGKLVLMPKKEVKANIGRSPDISDMLMMRELFELAPKPQGLSVGNR